MACTYQAKCYFGGCLTNTIIRTGTLGIITKLFHPLHNFIPLPRYHSVRSEESTRRGCWLLTSVVISWSAGHRRDHLGSIRIGTRLWPPGFGLIFTMNSVYMPFQALRPGKGLVAYAAH